MGLADEPIRVGLVVPISGPAGIFGPSCEAVTATALAGLNQRGLLGRRLEVTVIDGGQVPSVIAAEVAALLEMGRLDAITGWHISAVREVLAPVVAGRIPYIYTSLYEGGEARRGVFCCGETPEQQVAPALRWLRDERGVRSWYIVGDDYIWPRSSAAATRSFAHEFGIALRGAMFVPLGVVDFTPVIDAIAAARPDGVLLYLVGQDAVHFNRCFAASGLQDRVVRYSPLMEETMLLGSGQSATTELFVSASYFRTLVTSSSLELLRDYVDDHGPDAPPLNNAAESCYEGLSVLRALVERAGTLDPLRLGAVTQGVGYDGPRGPVTLQGNHVHQRVHLARAIGCDFDVLARL